VARRINKFRLGGSLAFRCQIRKKTEDEDQDEDEENKKENKRSFCFMKFC
jgi:hypothetical protein